jgi:hypothetical protein
MPEPADLAVASAASRSASQPRVSNSGRTRAKPAFSSSVEASGPSGKAKSASQRPQRSGRVASSATATVRPVHPASRARASAAASKPPRFGMSRPASRTRRPSSSRISARSVTVSTFAEPEATPQAATGAPTPANPRTAPKARPRVKERRRKREIDRCAGANAMLGTRRYRRRRVDSRFVGRGHFSELSAAALRPRRRGPGSSAG